MLHPFAFGSTLGSSKYAHTQPKAAVVFGVQVYVSIPLFILRGLLLFLRGKLHEGCAVLHEGAFNKRELLHDTVFHGDKRVFHLHGL